MKVRIIKTFDRYTPTLEKFAAGFIVDSSDGTVTEDDLANWVSKGLAELIDAPPTPKPVAAPPVAENHEA